MTGAMGNLGRPVPNALKGFSSKMDQEPALKALHNFFPDVPLEGDHKRFAASVTDHWKIKPAGKKTVFITWDGRPFHCDIPHRIPPWEGRSIESPVRERRYPNLTGVSPLKPLSRGAKPGKQPSRNATLLSWYGGIRSAE